MSGQNHPLDNASSVIAYPLSPMQQGMLFHSRYAAQSGVDIEQMIIDFHAGLDVTVFKAAWACVVARHAVLRSSFRWQAIDEPLQAVYPQVDLCFDEQDWRRLSAAEQVVQLATYLQSDRRQGFVMDVPPLMRFLLARLGETSYQCVWTFHHILMDGRSFPIVLKELFHVYRGLDAGDVVQLPTPRPYQQHIAWLQAQDLTAAEIFWRNHLKGFTHPTPLPTERMPAPATIVTEAHTQKLYLSADVTATLLRLAQENGLTLHTFVQAAWAILLSRYSGESDVLFGAPRACRRTTLEGANAMVGLLMNTVPVRVQVNPTLALLPFLQALRAHHLGLRAYEHTPLVKIQEWSDVLPALPLFNTLLFFENYQLNPLLQEVTASENECDFQLLEQTNFPLTLSGYQGRQLLLQIDYDRQRFDAALIAQILGELQTLLEAMVTDLTQPLATLPLLTASERHQILIEWNDTVPDIAMPDDSSDKCIHQLWAAQVERTPNAIAVIADSITLTYCELNQRANQLANHLQTLGVQPNRVVGLQVERSPAMLIGLLGILKAGGIYLPLDPAYPAERLAFMLTDAAVEMVVTAGQAALSTGVPGQVRVIDLNSDEIARQPITTPTNRVTPDDLAYIIYTSGSTGQPKGVMVAHGPFAQHCQQVQQAYALTAQDRVLQFASLNFDVSLEQIFPTLLAGATLVIGALWPPAEFQHKAQRFGLTVMDLPLGYCQQLLAAWRAAPAAVTDTALRLLIVGNEAIPHEFITLWQQSPLRTARLINAYGPTEAVISASLYEVSPHLPSVRAGGSLPIANRSAQPLRLGRQLYILDEQRQLVPIGVAGELYIGGLLAQGYLNRPEQTATAFVADPFRPGSRLYKTGDQARYQADGVVEFLGRGDQQVKIRGFRVELGEIEARLRQHPHIQAAVVVYREPHLVAYLVTVDPLAAPDEYRAFLRLALPEPMLPTVFVRIEEIPYTANGKIDRQALPSGRLPGVALSPEQAPRPGTEQQIAAIWSRLLAQDAIGRFANFFDLGGHSLLALQVANELQRTFAVNLPHHTLFTRATVKTLAEYIDALHVVQAMRTSSDPLPTSTLKTNSVDSQTHPVIVVQEIEEW